VTAAIASGATPDARIAVRGRCRRQVVAVERKAPAVLKAFAIEQRRIAAIARLHGVGRAQP
jgi:hypothetical protein